MGKNVPNFRPDVTIDQSRLETSYPQCKECGTIHPPTMPGECPVALGIKNKDEKKTKLIQAVQRELLNEENESASNLLIEMIEKTIKAWKVKKQNL